MARVTASDVLAIMKGSTLNDDELLPHIAAANAIVTGKCASDTDYDAMLLKEIERFLSAHFACSADPTIAQETIGGAAVVYDGKTGMGLDGSPFGQRAKILDFNGRLTEGKKSTATSGLLMENY